MIFFALPLLLLTLAACAGIATPQGWSGGVVNGDVLYIGTMQGEVLAVDRINQQTRWKFTLNGEEKERALYGTPVIEGDTLYIGGYDSQLYALSLEGNLVWQEPIGGAIVGSPAISGDTIVVSSADQNVYALSISDQSQKWKFPTEGKVWGTPVIEDGVVYFGSLDHRIYAVSLEDGSEIWRFSTSGAINSTPLVVDGRLYVGSFEGIFYALNASSGSEIWRFEGSTSWYWAAPIARDGTIYAGSLDGNLYALDINTGRVQWTLPTEGKIVGTPTFVNSMIAVPSDDGRVRVARLADGTEIGACNVGTEVRTPLVERDGVIYFAGQDSSIRAMSIKPNGNPDEEWVYLTNEDDPIPRNRAPAC